MDFINSLNELFSAISGFFGMILSLLSFVGNFVSLFFQGFYNAIDFIFNFFTTFCVDLIDLYQHLPGFVHYGFSLLFFFMIFLFVMKLIKLIVLFG